MTSRAIPMGVWHILHSLMEMAHAVSGTPRTEGQVPQGGNKALSERSSRPKHFRFARKGGYRSVGGNSFGPSDMYGRIGHTDLYSNQEAFDLYRKMAIDKNPPL